MAAKKTRRTKAAADSVGLTATEVADSVPGEAALALEFEDGSLTTLGLEYDERAQRVCSRSTTA